MTVGRRPRNDEQMREIKGFVKRTWRECEEDFWARVDIRGMDECWEWTRAKNSKSNPLQAYGTVWMQAVKWRTHRAAFVFARGSIPEGMMVCHRCDNPPCCNPLHLFAGTSRDNAIDCSIKGRTNRERGEDRYNATLTEDDIREIRSTYQKRKNGGIYTLAKRFGVYPTMIHSILKRKRWKHVT